MPLDRILKITKRRALESKLEGEIQTMMTYMRAGKAPASVLQTIADLEAKVEELKATPEGPKPFDRAAFFKRIGARSFGLLVQSPQQLRAALRKLDIDTVTPYPAKDGGWSFESSADLAGLLTGGPLGERAG